MLPLFWCSRQVPKRRAKAIAFLFGTWCIVLTWTARNVIVLGDPILVAVGSGSVFMQGSDERVFTIAGKTKWYPVMYQAASDHGIRKPADNQESKVNAHMCAIGHFNYRTRWETAPLSFIPFFLKKALRLWYATKTAKIHSTTYSRLWVASDRAIGVLGYLEMGGRTAAYRIHVWLDYCIFCTGAYGHASDVSLHSPCFSTHLARCITLAPEVSPQVALVSDERNGL